MGLRGGLSSKSCGGCYMKDGVWGVVKMVLALIDRNLDGWRVLLHTSKTRYDASERDELVEEKPQCNKQYICTPYTTLSLATAMRNGYARTPIYPYMQTWCFESTPKPTETRIMRYAMYEITGPQSYCGGRMERKAAHMHTREKQHA